MGQEGERGEVGLGDGALADGKDSTVSSYSFLQHMFNHRMSFFTWLVCCCGSSGSACGG